MHIKEALNSDKLTYEKLNNVVKNSESHVSFFGTRYITAKGYEGSINLDKVVRIAQNNLMRNWNFDMQERALGKKIYNVLSIHYNHTDEIVKSSNLFTKFLFWIKNVGFMDGVYSTRWFFDEEYCSAYDYFTHDQVTRDLPHLDSQKVSNDPWILSSTLNKDLYDGVQSFSGSPNRYCIKEELLKA